MPGKKTIEDVEEVLSETESNVLFAKASRAAAAALEGLSNYGEAIPVPKNQSEWLALYCDRVWAYAGIFAIASTIAQLDFKVYRWENGEKVYLPDHPILTLLETPNEAMTGYDLMEGLVTFLESCGTGYFEIVHGRVEGEDGKTPLELWPIRPDRLKPEIGKDGKRIAKYVFQLKSHTKKTDFALDEVLPFRYFNPLNDWFGMGSLQPAYEALCLDKQMGNWNRDFFKHGTTAEGLLHTDKPLTPKEMQDLGAQIKEFLKGQSRKILILSKGLEWQSISVSPKDAEFLQGRKEARDQILAALGVPPCKVGLVAEAKYANYDLQTLSFHRDTILPKLKKIEGAINKHLVPQYPDSEGVYVEFDRTPLLKEDEDRLVERFGKAIRVGLITPNEACRRLGWPEWPKDQEGGDIYYMDKSIVSVSAAREEAEARNAGLANSGVGGGPGGGALPEDEQMNQRMDEIEEATIEAVRKIREELFTEVKKMMETNNGKEGQD